MHLLQKSAHKTLVVALGNPGAMFTLTPHNIAADLTSLWTKNPKLFQRKIGNNLFVFRSFYLLISPDFMNICGEKIHRTYEEIQASRLIVIVDEVDLQSGVLKLKHGQGNNGHNGIKNIRKYFPNFVRICCGVGRPEIGIPLRDFVLNRIPQTQFYPEMSVRLWILLNYYLEQLS